MIHLRGSLIVRMQKDLNIDAPKTFASSHRRGAWLGVEFRLSVRGAGVARFRVPRARSAVPRGEESDPDHPL